LIILGCEGVKAAVRAGLLGSGEAIDESKMRESVLLQQYRAPFLELNIIWTSEPQDWTALHRHRWRALATNRGGMHSVHEVVTNLVVTTLLQLLG